MKRHLRQRLGALIHRETIDDASAQGTLRSDRFAGECGRSGLSPAGEAQAAAQSRSGNVRRTGIDLPGADVLGGALADLRYTVRSLCRQPGFTAAVSLTLALAMGANAAIIVVVHRVLLQWPYPHADRLVNIRQPGGILEFTGDPSIRIVSTAWAPDYVAWRQHATTLEAVEAYRTPLEGDHDLDLRLVRATPGLLRLLGARPAVGRLLRDEDVRSEAAPVLVLTFESWMRRFGGDPGAVGRPFRLGDGVYDIVGVLEPLQGPLLAGTEAFVPWSAETDPAVLMAMSPVANAPVSIPTSPVAHVLARVREGVPLSQVQAELDAMPRPTLLDRMRGQPRAVSIVEATVAGIRPTLWALAGSTILILLISVNNVANLLLARASARHADFAVHAALGAGRRRLVRLLLAESMLLALLGGIGGIAVGAAAVGFLRVAEAAWIPRLQEVAIDGTAIAATLAIAGIVGLLLGLAPVVVLRGTLTGERHPPATLARGGGWLRSALVVTQLALSFVLLAGTGLMVRSHAALQRVPIGVDYQQVTLFSLDRLACGSGPPGVPRLPQCLELLDRLRAMPGVQETTLSSHAPLQAATAGMLVETLTGTRRGARHVLSVTYVTPDFFEFFRVRAAAGRLFASADASRTADAVVVDAAAAARLWLGESAVGQSVRFLDTGNTAFEVIGIVDPIHYGSLADETLPRVFRLFGQSDSPGGTYFIRHDPQVGPSSDAIKALVGEAGGSLRWDGLQTLDAIYDGYLREPRFYLLLLGSLGALGLVIASIGVYSIVAYSVARRTKEIGIRMVCGAGAPQIVGLFCRRTAWLVVIGLSIGVIGAAWLTRYIEGLLFGVEATDPVALGTMAALLTVAALVATVVPIRRALRVDAAMTLRSE